ncbi:Lacal_2735 family protein [Seonamhaeicola marinus]|uniref:Lacal_2735 family protein n=1 Tax=Seonamhaeicola marinus TaxID=1912246 RepID=A0A5D0I6A3_9FLAO|nr:Lacal_2735 family protein [Seonamhaeicola marinus]TYA78401.1 Lacal_2735 family protein [Seonamhaeicola marinus]
MFGIFKRKTEKEKLEQKFKKLMQEWHSLSSVNRAASDKKYAEAQKIAAYLHKLNHETS